MEIWASIVHTVDPTASRLPSLRNPRAVGDSVVCLTMCMLLGALLLMSPSVVVIINRIDGFSVAKRWSNFVPALSWPYALALAITGFWAVLTLAPPRGREPRGAVWTDIWRIAIGYSGWIVLGVVWTEMAAVQTIVANWQRLLLHAAMVVFAIVGLFGLRGVFGIIGERSRDYRRSRGGRQSLDLIMLAIVAGMIGAIGRQLAITQIFPWTWRFPVRTLSTTVMGMGHFMVFVGLLYLVLNAVWIRRSLRRPPPPLDQVLMPQVASDTWVPHGGT